MPRTNNYNKQCEHLGCNKNHFFNVPGIKFGRFCSEHKKEGMVDIRSKRCENPGCMKHPYFNVPGSKAAGFCSEHKEEGMVDIKNKKTCEHRDCTKQPHYNVTGLKSVRFCSEHKEEGAPTYVYCEGCNDGVGGFYGTLRYTTLSRPWRYNVKLQPRRSSV